MAIMPRAGYPTGAPLTDLFVLQPTHDYRVGEYLVFVLVHNSVGRRRVVYLDPYDVFAAEVAISNVLGSDALPSHLRASLDAAYRDLTEYLNAELAKEKLSGSTRE